jgi:DNA-binding transcriptional LysR family regulator
MVRHLELRLGVPLFERDRGRLAPTPEARALHGQIDGVYRGVKAVQDFAAALKSGTHVRLRIGATQSLGLEVVPRAVARLAARYPQTQLALEVATLAQMTELLLAEQLDVGVAALPLDHPGLALEPIGEWRMVAALPPGHPLAAKRRLRVRDVLGRPLVAFAPDTAQGRVLDGWYARERLPRVVAVEVRSAHTACALVAAGVGIAIVDDLTAHAFPSTRLAARPLAGTPAFPIHLVRSRHRPPSMPSRRFAEALADILGTRRTPAAA